MLNFIIPEYDDNKEHSYIHLSKIGAEDIEKYADFYL